AEDGIRDDLVTGVQTCALPISLPPPPKAEYERHPGRTDRRDRNEVSRPVEARVVGLGRRQDARPKLARQFLLDLVLGAPLRDLRSEERRVGKECRFWWVAALAE